MKQALYDAFRDLLEASQDLSHLEVGHTVVKSEYNYYGNVLYFYRHRIGAISANKLALQNRSGHPDECFDFNGRALEQFSRSRLYLPSPHFKPLFEWQEAIQQVRRRNEVLEYVGLRERERYYQLLLILPAPDPDPHTPLLLKTKLPEMNQEEKQALQRYYDGPQALDHVRKGQKVVWVCWPLFSSLVIETVKVARSTKKHLFLLPGEQMRRLLHLSEGEEIRFDRQGYRKDSHDRLCLPHKGFEYVVYSDALRNAIDELFRTRVHLASYEQILGLLSFLNSFPQSYGYYLPDLPGR